MKVRVPICVECGSLLPLLLQQLAALLVLVASHNRESGSKLPHSTTVTLAA